MVEEPGEEENPKADLFRAAIFCFGRPLSQNSQLRILVDFIIAGHGARQKPFPTIPGQIQHRLKIVPLLARIWFEYWEPVQAALLLFAEAYSGRQLWQGGKRTTLLGHVRDVYTYMQMCQPCVGSVA